MLARQLMQDVQLPEPGLRKLEERAQKVEAEVWLVQQRWQHQQHQQPQRPRHPRQQPAPGEGGVAVLPVSSEPAGQQLQQLQEEVQRLQQQHQQLGPWRHARSSTCAGGRRVGGGCVMVVMMMNGAGAGDVWSASWQLATQRALLSLGPLAAVLLQSVDGHVWRRRGADCHCCLACTRVR